MTETSWNAGIEAGKRGPAGQTAGEAWDAYLETEEAIRAFWSYNTADTLRAQRNFMHAFVWARERRTA